MSATKTILSLCAILLACSTQVVRANDSRQIVVESCKTELKRSSSECSCVADEAENRFNDKQYQFFLAMIQNKNALQAQQELNISIADMQSVAQEMQQIPAACEGK